MKTPRQTRDHITKEIWNRAGHKRRLILLALILIPSLLAASVMYSLMWVREWPLLKIIVTLLFFLLFSWISVGFWSFMAGMLVLLRRYDRFAVTNGTSVALTLPKDVRIALLFPIYNEDARKVFEGVRTVLQSLRNAEMENNFDIFILSDSTNPDVWVQEEERWYEICRTENAFNRIFYRRRKSNLKRKSGNVADFCRRWGANYRYMTVFDADSLMSGTTLIRMAQVMEAHEQIGILQTQPKAVSSRSLIARIQQFANHLYGPFFGAGVHYWQLGEAQYWGHNAIIRIEPFMRHCQLPRLPGRAPLGGDILSHDFVESALMRRAGYGVWLAYELDGSYEQCPPSLIDELVRDRRWCQGNLQHSRLIFTRGFFPTHRALFINGIMSYGSALLWFFFLLASSVQALSELFIQPVYFPSGPSLFPDWPRYFPTWALALLSGTAGLLFLPKILALLLVWRKGGAQFFGGILSMCASAITEVLVSTLLAPVRMLFHSFFVVATLLGRTVGWNPQNRDEQTRWIDALRFHWWGTLLGLAWGYLMYLLTPGFFLWLSPIVFGLAVSIPLSVWTSRPCKLPRLFLTPVDTRIPPELRCLEHNLDRTAPYCPFNIPHEQGFVRAVVIPRVFALHLTLISNKRRNSEQKTVRLRELIAKALDKGPETLSTKEKNVILSEAECLRELHSGVWKLGEKQAARWSIR
ncbi:MAG: glucans biosynthesis glucosyltransferase MdoH [Deltaproteobacteria bacterium]|jgi:membrane glycosyltransferase|nr:glucans biosynthesis glucosyltransferase MdoH [Deltaproteobacteria bacterium]